MLQYESVLTRPEHLEAAGTSAVDVGILLDTLAVVVEPIRISYLWRPALPDAGDDLVLETAVNGRADIVITFNRRHFEPAAARFGLEILAPADAVSSGSRRRIANGHTSWAARYATTPVMLGARRSVRPGRL